MTVRELIERLQALPPDLPVTCEQNSDWGPCDVTVVAISQVRLTNAHGFKYADPTSSEDADGPVISVVEIHGYWGGATGGPRQSSSS